MKWKKKLLKKELKHLQEMGITTLAQLKETRKFQIEQKDRTNRESCWDCRSIAEKLGLKDGAK